jgi:hypothetical protein
MSTQHNLPVTLNETNGQPGDAKFVGNLIRKALYWFIDTSGDYTIQVSFDDGIVPGPTTWHTLVANVTTGTDYLTSEDTTNPIPLCAQWIRILTNTHDAGSWFRVVGHDQA